MCINFVAIVASVLGLLNPTTGAIVHNAGSCFVVLLAALLYDRKYPKDKKKLKGSGNNNSGDVSPTPQ
jgi:cation transport ATPase